MNDKCPICKIVVPSKGDGCGKPASWYAIFPDNDKTTACDTCVVELRIRYKDLMRFERIYQ